MELAQRYTDYVDSVKRAWWYRLVRTTLASAYVLCYLSTTWPQLQMNGWSLRWK